MSHILTVFKVIAMVGFSQSGSAAPLAEKVLKFESVTLGAEALSNLALPWGYLSKDRTGKIRIFESQNLIPAQYTEQMKKIGNFSYKIIGYHGDKWHQPLEHSLSLVGPNHPRVLHLDSGRVFDFTKTEFVFNNSNVNPCENGGMEPTVEMDYKVNEAEVKAHPLDHGFALLIPRPFKISLISEGAEFERLAKFISKLPHDKGLGSSTPSALIRVESKKHTFYIDHTSAVGRGESSRDVHAYFIKEGKAVQFSKPVAREICEAV